MTRVPLNTLESFALWWESREEEKGVLQNLKSWEGPLMSCDIDHTKQERPSFYFKKWGEDGKERELIYLQISPDSREPPHKWEVVQDQTKLLTLFLLVIEY